MIKNLTCIIPFYNGHQYLSRLLNSIPDVPTIIVDDCSDGKPTIPMFGGPSSVTMIQIPEKGYFSGAVNFGIDLCTTDVLVLNQDTWFSDHSFMGIIDQYRDRYAMIGEKVKGENPAWPNGYIHGTFMFLRRDAIDKIGLLDAFSYPLWGATALWQLQACRAGFSVLPLEEIPGFHHERPAHEHFGSSIKSMLRKEPKLGPRFIQIPPLVSVVIPAYNHGKYLEDAVHSLIGGNTSLGPFPHQTLKSFEVIVVDDASTDGTYEICGTLCNPWVGVRYIRHTRNRGTAAAYNTGIKAAFGKYITTMSADDMRESWSLEKLVKTLEENPGHLIYDSLMQFTDGKRTFPWIHKWEEYDFNKIMYANTVPTGTMFEKSAWEKVGGYPEKLKYGREDWGFALAMGRMGYCGILLDNRGYLYRRHDNNRTLRNITDEWKARFAAQMVELFPDLYSGRFPMACCGRSGSGSAKKTGLSSGGFLMAANDFVGVTGMTLVEYVGKNVGSVNWGGPKLPSRRVYIFGDNPRDKKKLVDDRDVAWFLAKRSDSGQPLFRRSQQQAAGVTITPDPATVTLSSGNGKGNEVDLSSVDLTIGEEAPDPDADSIPDPSEVKEPEPDKKGIDPQAFDATMVDNMNIKQILELSLTTNQWVEVYNHEKNKSNGGRKTLITVLEEKIEEK